MILQPFLETQSFPIFFFFFLTAGIAVHKFSLCFVRTDQWASGEQCMEVRKAIIPAWNVTRMKRKWTMTVFWEMTLESKLLDQFQWSWYHYGIFSNSKVIQIECSEFGTPGIYISLPPPPLSLSLYIYIIQIYQALRKDSGNYIYIWGGLAYFYFSEGRSPEEK